MNPRWLGWTAGIAALALIGTFPLRIALGWSDLERIGFAARQVAGTIWYGRIGELHLRSQPLGTLEVALDPAAVLIGDIGMRFNRLDNPDGPLEGRLVAGFSRGLVDTSGRIAVGQMFAPLPIAALELHKVTVVFRDGRCERAAGRVSPMLAAPVPGLNLASGLSGAVECDGKRARVEMETPSGSERIDFFVQDSGEYRGWISVRNQDPVVTVALAVLGFRPSPDGMTLQVDGRL